MPEIEPRADAAHDKRKGSFLSPLRSLVPSRLMVGCLALIAVAGGWYYFSSESKADHLVKRNFNYLNQVASNINATTRAVEAALVFNSNALYECLEKELGAGESYVGVRYFGKQREIVLKGGQEGLRTALSACVNTVKQRLLRNGPMIQDSRDMEVVISVEGRPIPAGLFNLRQICGRGSEYLVERFKPSLVNATPDGLLYMFFFHAVATGQGCNSNGESAVIAQTPSRRANEHVIVNVSVRVPLTRVQGFAQEETYFDAIALARTDGSESEVIFTNTEAGIRIDQRDLRSLFSKRSGFERFISLREQEVQHSALQQQQLQAGRNAVKPTSTGTPFKQSTFIPTVVGGFANLAFVQPFRFYTGEYTQSDDYLLVGFTSESAFNTEKYTIPLNWLSYLLLLFFGAALSLNFVRLRLIRDRGIVHRRDVLLATFSMVGIGALVVVYFVHRLGSFQFNDFYDDDLETVHQWIKKSFHAELDRKMQTLETAGFALYHGSSPDLGADSQCPPLVPREGKQAVADSWNEVVSCTADGMPEFSRVYFLDGAGRQQRVYLTHLSAAPPLRFNIESREYFKRIDRGGAWAWPPASRSYADSFVPKAPRYFMERIESRTEGSLETAISLPVTYADRSQSDPPQVLVGLTKFETLEQPVLPPGMGFAVFEDATGRVLFHSDGKRSLREFFYRATDDDAALKAAVISRLRKDLTLNYKGDAIDAIAEPLKYTGWTLVTYHEDDLIGVVNFHFGITAVVLATGFILGTLVVVPLIWLYPVPAFLLLFVIHPYATLPALLVMSIKGVTRLLGKRPQQNRCRSAALPQWMYPIPGANRQYRCLLMIYLAIAVIYTIMLYMVDLPWTLLSIAGVMIITPFFWWLLLQRVAKCETRKPDSDEKRTDQNYRLYRANVCFLVILVSVLPTMHLHNENYDIHEKLWVEFYTWSNIDRMKARKQAYDHYVGRFEKPKEGGKLRSVLDTFSWRGVYLPRTYIYSLKKDVESCEMAAAEHGGAFRTYLDREPPLENLKAPRPAEIQQSIFVELKIPGVTGEPDCHLLPIASEALQLHDPESRLGHEQTSLFREMLEVLPDVNDLGSLLETFVQLDLEAGANEESKDSVDPVGERKLLYSESETGAHQLSYAIHNYFPHTRPENKREIFLPYVITALLSAMVIWSLQNFLLRAFLARDIGLALAELEKLPTRDDLESRGGIIVVPAGYSMERAREEVFSLLLGESQAENSRGFSSWGRLHYTRLKAGRLVLIDDFRAVVASRADSARVLEQAEEACQEGGQFVIISDIDVAHWLWHFGGAEGITMEERHRWEALLSPLTSYRLPGVKLEGDNDERRYYRVSTSMCRNVWECSSEDEQMVMAGLCHEGIVNPRNTFTLKALLRRRLIEYRNGHFEYGDCDWRNYVDGRMHKSEFRERARRYKNSSWRSFRGPIMLALLVLVFFIAYVAQDEMQVAFSILTTVGGTLAALSAFSDRIRDFRSYLGN